MNTKIIYKVNYYYHERTGTYSDYNDYEENADGEFYESKELMQETHPDILSESELIKANNAYCINDLPDGSYIYYTEEKLYY